MNKLIRIDVDEPDTYVLMSQLDRNHYHNMLPSLIDSVLFCVFNHLFNDGTSKPVDIIQVANLISMNVLFNTPSRGLTFNCRKPHAVLRPFEEVVVHLMPVLAGLSKFSKLVGVEVKHQCIQITIQDIN